MKAQSNILPKKVQVDVINDLAVVSLFSNVVQVEKEEVGIVYEYDYYKLELPNRDGLVDDIRANFKEWVDYAIQLEGMPRPETDKEKLNRVDRDVVEVKEVIEVMFGG